MDIISSFVDLTITEESLYPTCGDYVLFTYPTLFRVSQMLFSFLIGIKGAFGKRKKIFRKIQAFERVNDKLLSTQLTFNMTADAFDRRVHEIINNDGFHLDDSEELCFDIGGGEVLVYNENLPVDYVLKSWNGLERFYYIMNKDELKETLAKLYRTLQTLLKNEEEFLCVCLNEHGTPPGIIQKDGCVLLYELSSLAQEALCILATKYEHVCNSELEDIVKTLTRI